MAKQLVEKTKYLSINDVKSFLVGQVYPVSWSDGNKIKVKGERNKIILLYKIDGKNIKRDVTLSVTKVGFGYRPWFNCPDCERKTANLYLKSGVFSCRNCSDLTYNTSRKSGNKLKYLAWKILGLQMDLGMDLNSCGLYDYPAHKPKYMHCSTFANLMEELVGLQHERDQEWLRLVSNRLQPWE